jgi:hypothetical protein
MGMSALYCIEPVAASSRTSQRSSRFRFHLLLDKQTFIDRDLPIPHRGTSRLLRVLTSAGRYYESCVTRAVPDVSRRALMERWHRDG